MLAATSRDKRSFLSPVIIGLGIWIGFPTVAAYQDMASLVSGIEGANARWNAFVEKSVAGSVHAAEMPFVDADITTGSISGSGMVAPGIGAVSLRGKGSRSPRLPTRTASCAPARRAASSTSRRSRRRKPSTPARSSSAPACCVGPTDGRGQDGLRQARHPRQGSRDRRRLLHQAGQEARSGRAGLSSPTSSTTRRPTFWPPPMRRRSRTMPGPRPSRAC